ncbi:hypothetical protein BDR26DRAFT_878064 [Obelidium mucronatum]|nr:hypothetical protein BDR26DRAFT_878064 [Obelidium mucronatum]
MELITAPSCSATNGCANPKTICDTSNADNLAAANFAQGTQYVIRTACDTANFNPMAIGFGVCAPVDYSDSGCTAAVGSPSALTLGQCNSGANFATGVGQFRPNVPVVTTAPQPVVTQAPQPGIQATVGTSGSAGSRKQQQSQATVSPTAVLSSSAIIAPRPINNNNNNNGNSTVMDQKPGNNETSTPVPAIIGSVIGVLVVASLFGVTYYRRQSKVKRELQKADDEAKIRAQNLEAQERAMVAGGGGVVIKPENIRPIGIMVAGQSSLWPRNVSLDPNDWTVEDAGRWVALNGGGEDGELVIHAQKINGRALLVLQVDVILKEFHIASTENEARLHAMLLDLRARNTPNDALPLYAE